MTVSASRRPRAAGWWIPWLFVAFFGVVVLANGVMIAVALGTWTGLETRSAYQRGLDYNRALAAERAQVALGWDVALAFDQSGARRGVLEVALADRHGDLLEDARVEAKFVRPTHAGQDVRLEVPHHYGGRYRADVELPLAGLWEVRVVAREGGDTYRLRERVWLEP